MTSMEIEGAKHGAFSMDKEEGREACREYRAKLEAQGKRTWLDHFAADIYIVRYR